MNTYGELHGLELTEYFVGKMDVMPGGGLKVQLLGISLDNVAYHGNEHFLSGRRE